jgi:hypothetical protein
LYAATIEAQVLAHAREVVRLAGTDALVRLSQALNR